MGGGQVTAGVAEKGRPKAVQVTGSVARKRLEGFGGGAVIKPFGEENDSHFFPHLEVNHCSMTQAETLEPSDCVDKGVGGVIEAAENSGLRRAVGPASSQD